MTHTYKVIELVGSSTSGIEDAISSAVMRASESTRHLDWFAVTEIRGQLQDGAVAYYQVGLKVGFRVESED